MQEKCWEIAAVDDQKVDDLQKALGIKRSLCKLMIIRGLETYDQAHEFFRPKLAQLHDPFLMKNMQKAADRIIHSIESGEKILIYGDYDVDGTTAVSAMLLYFRKFYPNVDYYIPNRYREGYGISQRGMKYAVENDFSLVIALDCGITAVEQIAFAKENGVDVIVCDHHLPSDVLPPAHAILDPKQVDCGYPFKELSGCGIGLKLIQALVELLDQPIDWFYELLDLGVISIASDIVPITGENRILAYYGLKKISRKPLPGVRQLMELASLKPPITISNIVFGLGPRINAAGRMDDARDAVRLLTSEVQSESINAAELLHNHNNDRRNLDKAITESALAQIEADENFLQQKSTVVFDPDWHKGVIGIVASRLVEQHYRPTIVFTEKDGLLTGSARSISGFNIHTAIAKCGDLLENFGGHKYAAGMALRKENFSEFKARFNEVVSKSITDDLLRPVIRADTEIELDEINDSFYKILKQFAPFGPGNRNPVFIARNVKDTGYGRIVGENHLKLSLKQDNETLGAIAFGLGRKKKLLDKGKRVDICFTIEENEYLGSVSLQLNIKDLKAAV